MRSLPRTPLLLLGATLLLSGARMSAQTASTDHMELRRAAQEAYQKKDYAAAREAYAAALALRPDSPRYLHNLAATQALTSREPEALATLRRLAALGIATAVDRDPDFASLQGKPAFNAIRATLAENRDTRGEADLLAELPGRTGIIEGIVFRERTGDLFLGDVHHRCIWRRDHDGRLARFTVEHEELFGIFGLALDETRDALWAATSALPEMSGFTGTQKGRAALAEFALSSSDLRRIIEVPSDGRDHVLGDLVVARDGTVYATDSLAPIIWKYTPGGEEMEKFLESPNFVSLQGLVLSDKALVVADYANGLFVIDLTSTQPTARPLAPPPNSTLVGLDGLVPVSGGLVAIQNGTTPQRVLRVALAPDLNAIKSVTVVAAALPHFADLTLVTLVNGRPTFLANAGWDDFDPTKAEHPRAHTVRIFQVAAQ